MFYVHFVTPLQRHVVLQSIQTPWSRKKYLSLEWDAIIWCTYTSLRLWAPKQRLNYTQIEAYIHEVNLSEYIAADSVSDQMYFYVYPSLFANIHETHQIVLYNTRASCRELNLTQFPCVKGPFQLTKYPVQQRGLGNCCAWYFAQDFLGLLQSFLNAIFLCIVIEANSTFLMKDIS